MKKLTFTEVCALCEKHNQNNNIKHQFEDKNPLVFVAVVDNKSFNTEYPLESRSYSFRSDNKYFLDGKLGNSIFSSSLDNSDPFVRLDWYLVDWTFEYFYLLEGGEA